MCSLELTRPQLPVRLTSPAYTFWSHQLCILHRHSTCLESTPVQSSHLPGAPSPHLSHPSPLSPTTFHPTPSGVLWSLLQPLVSGLAVICLVLRPCSSKTGTDLLLCVSTVLRKVPAGSSYSVKRQNEAPSKQFGDHQLCWKCTLLPTRWFRLSARPHPPETPSYADRRSLTTAREKGNLHKCAALDGHANGSCHQWTAPRQLINDLHVLTCMNPNNPVDGSWNRGKNMSKIQIKFGVNSHVVFLSWFGQISSCHVRWGHPGDVHVRTLRSLQLLYKSKIKSLFSKSAEKKMWQKF